MSKYLQTCSLITVLLLMLKSNIIEGSCPTGHYCPTPEEQIACPKGFYNPLVDSTSQTDCLACPGGQYCATDGLSAPTGACSGGWFCSGGDISPEPMGKQCWPRYHCPAGSSTPTSCLGHQYQSEYGQSSCLNCPAESYCMNGGLIGTCDDGHFCLGSDTSPTQNECGQGRYCVNGKKQACPKGTFQSLTGQRECEVCQVSRYCKRTGLSLYSGKCWKRWWCDPGSIYPNTPGQECPKGHRCRQGYKFVCGKGLYQDMELQTDCNFCPVGHYCGNTTTINPTPCPLGQCCHEGFIEPTSCHKGEFLHLTYAAASRPTFAEANALCMAQGIYKLAVVDTEEEYNRMMSWFLATSAYIVDGVLTLPAGVWLGAYWESSTIYKWDMTFGSYNLTWANWASGQDPNPATEKCVIMNTNNEYENVDCGQQYDILCETSNSCGRGSYYDITSGTCVDCPDGYYCPLEGLFEPSGLCEDGWYCLTGAFSPNSVSCFPGKHCKDGIMNKCPPGMYQPLNGQPSCLPCPAGVYCSQEALLYWSGLCHAGYYCPLGTIYTFDDGFLCPKGHYCPTGSGSPVPCESGKYQDQEGQGLCKTCPENMYCDQSEAEVELTGAPNFTTHGVITPKSCPALIDCQQGSESASCDGDSYNDPGVLDLTMTCTPSCDEPVSNQENISFWVSCSNCETAFQSFTWSIRECTVPNLAQCQYCLRRIHYIDNNDDQSLTYERKWSRFDVTGWTYFSAVVKVVLVSNLEGMMYKMWTYFEPWTGPVSCSVTPDNGQPMDTQFSISCDPVPGEESYAMEYKLYAYNVLLYQGVAPISNVQLPEANTEDNFNLPLHLDATINTHFFYQTDLTVQINPPDQCKPWPNRSYGKQCRPLSDCSDRSCLIWGYTVCMKLDGGYTDWTLWGLCTHTCGTGSQTRSRDCTNPTPHYGGEDCIGDPTGTQDCNTNPCPIDGGYTEWTAWDTCTHTCGTGSQTRSRDCTNPTPQYGGADCVGDPTETQNCNTNPCPIDGGYTDWTAWDTCTLTCGTGSRTKSRDCTNPTPQYGGADCVGDPTETQNCNTNPCPIDGGYTEWTAWDTCTHTCGTGSQTRSRDCTNPIPQHGGSDCNGDATETQNCNTNPCPVDGGYTEWTTWDTCTQTCGTGSQIRSRDCTNPTPQYGGANCIGDSSETQDCNTSPCPIDGGYTDWTAWDTCTLTCGAGSQTRSRECTNPIPQYGGADCIGDASETQDCNTNLCPIDGGYTEWTAWDTCTHTCGTGSQTRSRDCTNPTPQYGGADCIGDATETQDCNTNPCPIDGGYTEWTAWDTCTLTCGTGSQTRSHDCTNPIPQYGGADCIGEPSETQDCNTNPCPIDGGYTEWTAWDTCTHTCGTGSQTRSRDCTNPTPQYGGADCIGDATETQDCNTNPCPIDGGYTEWTAWDTCTLTCGTGSQTRSHDCTNPIPQYGGADCIGEPSETQDCNTNPCPIDGGYTEWTAWDTCTHTCGTGSQTRSRDCTNPTPQYGGADCIGDATETQDCNTNHCPIDGGYTEWTAWDTCTLTCGTGSQTRTHDCTNPIPQYGGAGCIGEPSETQDCNTNPCPIDGGYTEWTAWDTCTHTCGTGSHARSRDCTNPTPQYGGADCIGDATETQDCNTNPCPIDGGYTEWTAWDTCTLTCGTGSQTRSHDCTNPIPQYGGADCIGEPSETQDCNTNPCPIDGGYTEWTAWDTCTHTCGTGSQTRSRDCTNPTPQYGGADCIGDATETQDCNTNHCPIDGGYTEWTAWDTCTLTCGTGSQTRTHDCTNPIPQYGGAGCIGEPSETQDCNTNPCPIDGGYTEWTAWDTCTHTCGTGSHARSRDCTNPTPQYGGADCIGDATETQDCNTNPCPIDGGYTEWTAWDTCTLTCGTGSQTRTHDCTNPIPQYGGADCIGEPIETQDCNTTPCPIDGGYTVWTAWDSCTLTCGTGSQMRSRDCANPTPQYGGADCIGDATETQDCNTNPCSIDGGYTEWTAWDTCTLTCGTGSQTRSHDCTNPIPQYGGADCIGEPSETQDCNTNPCPIDGGYTEWTAWDTCTHTCGTGSHARSRDCTNPTPQYGGADCIGDATETQDCNTNPCPIDGGYTEWTAWDTCTLTCGTGSQTRTHDCTNPIPQYGGADCIGEPTETQDCNTTPCPIDGGYTVWTAWDSCTLTCGTGSQMRSRDCANPTPQYGGADCIGDATETQDCNTNHCPIDGGYTEWTAWDTCTLTCGTGSQTRSHDCTNPIPQYGGADCIGEPLETQDCNTNPCPIDGGYTEWTAWDTCTHTCGTGSHARSRDCTNPTPQYGGADCIGDSTETQDCNTNPCPIDGGYTEWTAWDTCTLTCGTGSQTRTHDCTNPIPQYGGADCIGEPTETQDCNTTPCPIDGGYTVWTAWDSCTLTCGTGSQMRSRDCANPTPQYGGADCIGDATETQDCNTNPCPIDGGYTEWTAWDTCTLTCGTGSQTRSHDCTNPIPQYGGADCIGEPSETQDCNTNPCPIDGGYTEWTAWDTCTHTCGTGSHARSRDCTNPTPQYGGADCIGDSTETQDCNTNPCPIDGGYTEWTAWDTCTLTCGTGSQTRTHDCTNPIPQYGGADCIGEPTETQDCNTTPCPIDGGYTVWTAWDSCTLTCGTGSQMRSRDCANPTPQYGGADCIGDATETQDCNTNPCPIDGGYTEWTAWDTCTLTCGTGSQTRSHDCTNPYPQYGGADCIGEPSETQDCNTNPCPIDGGYTEWTAWDTCTHTCGTGSQTRSRDCTNPSPQYGGADCIGDATETQDCNTNPCPIDGGYTEWTAWDTCTLTCGTGSQTRSHDCTNPIPQYGGADCIGEPSETQDCNTNPCPIDGGYTEWTAWDTCTHTCGTGSQTRSRDCTNPTPQYGGADCIGDATETQDCNTNPCPIDGGYTEWTAWDTCTLTCGTGIQTRTHDCSNPTPQYGGADCIGDATETQDCNTNPCPIDGGYTEWTAWDTCTLTCGTGSQTRSHDCTNPIPQYGGADCIGEPSETQDCNTNPCPIDGGYTEWTAWDTCTLTCGTGIQTRTHDCSNPTPQYGGADCIGDATETQDCNTNPCPIDGGYTEWTAWDTCTLTCGTGSQTRSHDCTNPIPQYGGADCIGEPSETQDCNTNPCPIDGGYTEWTAWDTCTHTCGTGSHARSRDCTNPTPQYGGADCIGDATETQDCNTNPCPIDGGYTEWTAWDTCTLTCGTGSQTRTHDCTNPIPQYGGADCIGEPTETQDCNTTPCPIDGGYTVWTAWDSCTLTCGTGSQMRSRDCANPTPQYGGADCIGDATETLDCNTNPCPIDGGYTEWTAWDTCTLTCGTGSQTRSHDCTNPYPQYGGADCIGEPSETQDCNTNPCPIDGGYTEWTAWDTCTHTCGTGSQTRSRDCTNPTPQYGGSDCIGDATETQDCNTNPCPIDGGYTEWTAWDTCTLTCGTGSQTRSHDCTNPIPQYGGADCIGEPSETQDCNTNPCPIDGGYTEWTVWDTCTHTCGTGSQTRSRDCTNPTPQYGGADCIGDATETQDCNTNPCPIDGGYTEWTAWDTCTLTCGTGIQTRTHDCSNPIPQYGGADCIGEPSETQDCNTNPCPIDGGYTVWTAWDTCTHTCGTGSHARSRDCTNPTPQYGGADCIGDATETQDCNTNPCPIDGGYTEWTAWDTCTHTCGTGSQTRTHDCTNPIPQYGGADCIGDLTETQDCNTTPCPIDGGYTLWTAWDSCTLTCGTGSQMRSRDCTNPTPQYGGADCIGDGLETQDCNTNYCPIDGGYTEWSAWDTCTLTCGTGSQTRTHDCTNPTPQYGGAECVGDPTQTQNCNINPCPIDGGYTEWTLWDTCTHTCGTGSQTRSRECTNPTPQYGGTDCIGDLTETQNCNTNPCPIDGGYTEWTLWDTCTYTCGTGSQTRSHDCTNPTPQYGGADCIGDATESQDCNTNTCPIDGGYTEWTAWDTCSLTCGTGSQTRSRDCTNPTPQYGGLDCIEDPTETQNCNTNPCPIDGGYTEWTAWDTCTHTCGTGSQTRSRDCTNPTPQYGGADCIGDPTETQDCNTNPCAIDGGYTEWTAWDTCTHTCGTGSQMRSRDCTNPTAQYGGADCIGDPTESQNCNTNPCPIDGGYTDWTAWDTCTLTCGTGSQTRSHDCTNPIPQYGGADCIGEPSETQDCNTTPCPIDGGYTVWTAWYTCTLTCGTGSQIRSRDCTNPTPQYGGADCIGGGSETQDCNTNPCPIDGGYTEWSAWDTCTLTCGTGSQTRTHDCTNPTPQYGGADCVGDPTQTQNCNINPCPIDGGYTEWALWDTCTHTCGTGSQTRSHECTNPTPQYGGADCIGDHTETQDCNTNPCPIDGGYTEWTGWDTCTLTCGTGSQTRSRDCTNPTPQYGGADCAGEATESQNCNTNPCPIDGGYTEWTLWDTCTSTCGTGSQTRSRDCTNPTPQYGGADCVGDPTETQNCNTNPCPIDGGYTDWTLWDTCSHTCGTGSQTRSRDCTNPNPQYGGADCIGDHTETQSCNTNPCPIDGGYTEWTAWDTCTLTCGTGSQTRTHDCTNPYPLYGGLDCVEDPTETQNCNTYPCPIDGGYTEWTLWDTCTHTCGTGSQTRSRDCTNPTPQYGGADCIGDPTETQDCNTNPCPFDGGYTVWTAWDTCTDTCGTGSQMRSRDCNNPTPQYGGADCIGDDAETQDCNTYPCPIDGGYTDWTAWDTCSHTCGTGVEIRLRSCTNPAPQYGGADCSGNPTEGRDCNTNPCPIDGGYTEWTLWNTCTKTCGTGSQTRSHDCTNPTPQYGGADCIGDASETQDCNTNPCPIDGGYTEWTAWGTCTLTCGTGSQTRTHDCTNPIPQYGGADCIGDPTETQNCNTYPCPIDGGYTDWTAWDTCTLTCGTGSQTRTHDCTNPIPQYGGADCIGDPTETQDCNINPCPIDGGYTEWTAWYTCTLTCGTGSQTRSRDCTNPTPLYGGLDCIEDPTETQNCNTYPCPIDGGYTEWTAWDTCTHTCGTGSQTRSRDCTNPTPQYGDADCIGDPTETQDCNTNPCPIDGGYTEWTAWDTCTHTCGTGSQTRSRDCTNPTAQYGSADCIGDPTESQNCNTNPCPIDGGYTEWTAWDTCTLTCGTGSQTRTHDCTNPIPQYGGADCIGDPTETQDCNTNPCPIDGGYTEWTAWYTCTLTCGTGSQTRTRGCTNPTPQYGGADCIGDPAETQDCNTNPCPIDGGYTDWTVWDTCTLTCGTGSQTRTHDCTNPIPQYGGADCIGDPTETQDCNINPCPIDGGYTEWTAWYTCTLTCGTGSQTRSRDCTNPTPLYGGLDCIEDPTETQNCNTYPCPIDGGYTEWTAWDTCTHTCGTGSQTRSRDCTNPTPQYGGADCIGDPTETQDCNTNPCPIDGGYTEWTAWDTCTHTCGTGSQTRSRDCTNPTAQYGSADCIGDPTESQNCNTNPCPIDGGYTEWTAWDTCTLTCGTGSQTRTHDCTNPIPQYGGADCIGDPTETQDCNTNPCPIDGGYTEWTAWYTCTLTCGTGSQTRTRGCTNPTPQYGGADCIGDPAETQDCNTNPCPIDGGYTDWTVWDTCTLTCGTGSQTRTHDCTNPIPQYGGADCIGDPTETQDCNINPCPIDGGYTEWTAWYTCTLTCGTGSRTRSRDCTNPTPLYGGLDCIEDPTETQNCNTYPCPIDGGYTEWTAWDTCTHTCGTGSQTRSRDCTNPTPQYGGADCIGDPTETQDCNTNPCPIDGGYTEWTAWDTCTHTCRTGSQTRSRDCTNPTAQYGGADCIGDPTESQNCNTNPCPIDGGYTEWTAWDTCTLTCGTGSQTRTHDCTNPIPQYGGADCIGDPTETQDCNTNPCPIDGGYTEWTAWYTCTLTCGTGSQTRTRGCTNPTPQYGGADCIGDPAETQDCNTNPCPIDGGYTDWTVWDTCTLTCGTGSQTRTHDCTNPTPQYGGADCIGDPMETQDCNTNPCPFDGGYTEWTAWDTCTHTCGTGSQTRSHDCTYPTPQYGGADCIGEPSERQDCNTDLCPIDGGYTEWTLWDTCTKTCGTGSQMRSHDCTNPMPQYGGADCIGDPTETQDCNTDICPDPYDPGTIQIQFSCFPRCTSRMSSALVIFFDAVCQDCQALVSQYIWTLRPCEGYSVEDCDHYPYEIYYINNSSKTYEYDPAAPGYDVDGWSHFGMYIKVILPDGNFGMTYHIWRFFNPVTSPVSCSVAPPTGISLITLYNITCEDVETPEGANVSYSLYKETQLLDLLYKGPTPNASNLLLPVGWEDSLNNLYIHMLARIQGHLFYRTEAVVQVMPSNLEEVMRSMAGNPLGIQEGGELLVDQQIQHGDVNEAVQILVSATDILNNHTVFVYGTDGYSSNQTGASNQSIATLIEFRTQLAKSVSKINISSYDTVSTVSVILNKVTEKTQDLSQEAREIATDTYSDLAEGLTQSLATAEEEIPQEQVANTAEMILKGAGAMLELYIYALEEELLPPELSGNDTDQTGSTQTMPAPLSQNTTEEIDKLLKTVDTVCNGLGDRQIPDDEPTIIVTEQVQVAVQKLSPSNLGGTSIELVSPKDGKQVSRITLPSSLNLSTNTNDVRLQTVVMEKNPYVWTSNASAVKTPVIHISLKDSNQNTLKVSGLPYPIKLSIPANLDTTEPQHLRLKIWVDKWKDTLTLKEDPGYYPSKATFTFPVTSNIVGCLKFTMPTNLTTLKVHISQSRRPELHEIIHGNSYPDDVSAFLEKFGDYLAGVKSSSIIYFVQNSSVKAKDKQYTMYAGTSVDIDKNETVRLLEFLDPNCVGNVNLTRCQGFMETSVEFRTFTLQCLYWNEMTETWSDSGCWVSAETSNDMIGCECNHLSAFGGSILAQPSVIAPVYDIKLFPTFFENPVVVTTVLIVWMIYIFLVQWARKADRKDEEKEGVVKCVGSSPSHTHGYLVCIVTGWWKQAGTTANVFMYIKGTLGQSRRTCLTSAPRECLQTGSEDWFLLTTEHSLGNLHSVILWHDNSGASPQWYLNQVFVKDMQRGESWMFLCNDWLALDRGHLGLTSITIASITEEELRYRQKYHFFVKTTDDIRDSHIWVSIFSKRSCSSFTRVQRLTCCLSILLTIMLTDLMFYGIPTDDPEDQVSAGAFQMSLSQLAIGVESSLLMFPVNFVIIQLFLRAKPRPKFKPWWRWLQLGPAHTTTHKSSKQSSSSIKDHTAEKKNSNTDTSFFYMTKDFPTMKSHSSQWPGADRQNIWSWKSFIPQNWPFNDVSDVGSTGAVGKDSSEKGDSSESRGIWGKDSSTMNTELRRGDRRRILPWWCMYIAWTVVMTACAVCSYFVMVYGLKYGYTRSVEWLVAFLTGFIHSLLIQEPVKAVAVAVLLSFILKKTVRFEDVEPAIEEDPDEEFERIVANQAPKHQRYVEPMSSRFLRQIKERLWIKWLMKLRMKDVVLQATVLMLLLVIMNSHRPVNMAYRSTLTVRNLFVKSRDRMPLAKVKTANDIYKYLHTTVVPAMEEVTASIDEVTLGSNHHIVGPYRLRQLRVKRGTCPYVIQAMISEGCDPGYGTSEEETQSFNTSWNSVPAPADTDSPWTYRNVGRLNTLTFPGNHGTYPGSGYVVTMPTDILVYKHRDIFVGLEDSGWFDERTRAVFLEFTLYNPGVDLLNVVVIMFELTNLGRVFPTHFIFTTSMFRYVDNSEMSVLMCEILFIALNIVLACIHCIKYNKIGRRKYFSDFWNIVEIAQIVLSFAVFGLFIHRYVTVQSVLSVFRSRMADTFVNFYPIVLSDMIMDYMTASFLALLMLKGMKLLQFHWRPRIIAKTLSHMRSPLLHFGLLFCLVILAYSHSTFLIFHKVLHPYLSFAQALKSNLSMLLGMADYADISENVHLFGPVFVVLFPVSVNYCLVNMYAVILNVGRIQVRDTIRRQRNKFRFNDYILNKLKMLIGFK